MAEQSQNPGLVSNTFTKGMAKDLNDTFQPEGMWSHARNAVNNSHDGQVGVIGNEPANLKCIQLPYTLIGAVHLSDDQWALFTTNDVNSEIGIFDESQCLYTKVVNASCLNFKKSNLITGVSRRRFDCERLVYWDDGLNPSRLINVNEPPFKYTDDVVAGCIQRTYTGELDCEKIRLAPLMTQPCLILTQGKGAGTLPNGSYQVVIAYTVNQTKVSDYIGLSNVQSLFTHQNVSSSLELKIDDIDRDFDEFELVVISTVNQQTVVKKLGYYSTTISTIYIDTISPELVSIPISQVPLRNEAVEKSDAIYNVNNYMLRVGTYSKYQFNYQLQANKIETKWVAVQYPANYYYKGGNNAGYLRDEQYSFFIRWIYNTGERSASFHIPGREGTVDEKVNVIGGDAFETKDPDNFETKQYWQVQNTGQIDSLTQKTINDGGLVIATGKLAYWESTERYPADRPDIWGDLCGKPIRHHKFPDETVDSMLSHFTEEGEKIVIMGVSFDNITHPLGLDKKPLADIIGYEILRGSREGQKSIVAKGMFNNLREYDIPGTPVRGLYQNYPYNDLRHDYYLTTDPTILDNSLPSTTPPVEDDFTIADTDDDNPGNDDDDDGEKSSRKERREERRQRRKDRRATKRKLKDMRKRLKEGETNAGGVNLSFPLTDYRRDYLSFHSPDTSFTRPFLGVSEVKIYQELHGESRGRFTHPYKHPKFKTLTNFAGIFGSIVGTIAAIGNVLTLVAGDANITLQGNEKLPYSKKLFLSKLPATPVSVTAFGTGVTIPDPVVTVTNTIVGVYNATMAVAMTVIESQALGEQIINIIYGMVPKRQNALQYDSHGFYNKTRINNQDNRRFRVNDAIYVDDNITSFDANYSINNVYRSPFVAVKLGENVDDPVNQDMSRFRIGNRQINGTYSRTISGYYGSLKVSIPSQYGQLEGIKQMLVSDCVHDALTPNEKYSTDVLFGGDTYINRFTEKNSMFFFNSWLMGEPDETEYDYRNYVNVAYPRFWIDSERQSFKLFSNMSNFRHLDERDSSIFFVSKGYFYLFNSGVRDFFVESEINLAYRDWEDILEKRHYDPYRFTDYGTLFRADRIKEGNYYKYDYSLSVSKLFNNSISWGTLFPRDYDPTAAEKCYTYSPNKVIYSLPQELELKKDNWRLFLANNYKNFGSRVTSIKPINRNGALFMMGYQSPLQFMGVDQLQTDAGTKITLGDGGLFNQPLQSVVNADESYEYGSSQNKLAVVGTPYGVFWVSQNQGKVFNYSSGISEISRESMKWWFANYLPSELLKKFPTYPLYDNPVKGVGVQMIYDNTHEILYITKKDYRPVFTDLILDGERFYRMVNGIKTYYDFNSAAFEDASWTISYDPKAKMWLSFHDWKPTYLIPGRQHFMSVDVDSIWKHNIRCDLFCNFYGKDYPFEVEFISATGQSVTTVRNIEYLLDTYTYYNNCRDKFHILDQNFDQAMVYNSEQISGLLELELKSKINPVALLNYPQVRSQSIGINFSKEENKYRFNQFWDVTKDRGEFTSAQVPMFITKANGYEYPINPAYVNYQKAPLERKKFRHHVNKVLLRKFKSGNVKFLFKISNQKIQASYR
jgi:hypothetical protein